MAASKTRLGRGLGALISGGLKTESGKGKQPKKKARPGPEKSGISGGKEASAATPPKKEITSAGAPGFEEIPVAGVDPNPFQPRREIAPENLKELAESIRSEGLLQPIVVRKAGERFQLIAGERRWRAFQLIGQRTIPARVIEAGDFSSASMALIENLQRENLNPIEEASGYASLVRDFDLTQEKVAERVGRGRASVSNSLRLLQLDEEIQSYLARELLSAGHAKVLLGLESGGEQLLVARRVIEQGLSVRDTERLVQVSKRSRGGAIGRGRASSGVRGAEQATITDIERRLGSHLNARVTLKHTRKKGRIQIEYQGNEDLQRILEKVGLRS